VAYTPDWEALADALKRVMAAGHDEDRAKTDLCRAVADRKIDVRVWIAASDHAMRGRTFSDGNVGVPPRLEPRDFDWVQSRPLKPWSIGPKLGEHYSWISGWENRPLDLVELSTAGVERILCSQKASGSTDNSSPLGAKMRGIVEAIKQCWPTGIPNGLAAKERNRVIIDWLKSKGYSIPKNPERAIQRALKALRSE